MQSNWHGIDVEQPDPVAPANQAEKRLVVDQPVEVVIFATRSFALFHYSKHVQPARSRHRLWPEIRAVSPWNIRARDQILPHYSTE